MLGPILIYSNKSCDSYFTLPTNLVRLNQNISNLKAFGTDGEKNLFAAFRTCFSEANHLLCTIHVKNNITNKCNDLGIDSSSYIEEIFGKKVREMKFRGLIDCYTKEEFRSETWLSKKNSEQFLSYIESFIKVSIEVCSNQNIVWVRRPTRRLHAKLQQINQFDDKNKKPKILVKFP